MTSQIRILAVLLMAVMPDAVAVAENLSLVSRGLHGSELVVDVHANELDGVGSMDLRVDFDAAKLGAPKLDHGPLGYGSMVVSNPKQLGSVRIGLISPAGVSGEGVLMTLRFPVRGTGVVPLSLSGVLTDMGGSVLNASAEGTLAELTPSLGGLEAAEPAVADEALTLEPSGSVREPRAVAGTWAEFGREDDRGTDLLATSEQRDSPLVPQLTGSEGAVSDAVGEGAGGDASIEIRHTLAAIGETAAVHARGASLPGSEQITELPTPEEELKEADLVARLAGYKVLVRFEPEQSVVADSPTEIQVRVYVFRHGRSIALRPSDVSLRGDRVRVSRVRYESGAFVSELRVGPGDLPAYIEVRVVGLYQRHVVPVYPWTDVDADASGDLTQRDLDLLRYRLGTGEGDPLYSERFDIVRDGQINDADYAAFEFILIEGERTRRLELLQTRADGEEEEVIGR